MHLQHIRRYFSNCGTFAHTDGFATALLSVDRRADLAAVIGAEAEGIVYLYASCDRKGAYPDLTRPDAAFHDRFTGHSHVPEPWARRDFAELSAANELDLARIDPAFRARWSPDLLALFARLRDLLTPEAWLDCRTVLARSADELP
ncbi:DUF6817 domain-containing protein [Streptomyces sp. NPDC058476]|uniref:DUF6817 domain-containing protein n=1 Tax=Streptomyces sp. NPDC058476 TaxID=3346519 RepID=UPI00366218E6